MNEHSDRDQSEEPVDLTGFEDAYANAPHADDERVHRYTEAMLAAEHPHGYVPCMDEARSIARAVMDVADAEQAELRAEVTKWRLFAHGETIRTEAAERALAVERAKVARVEALRDECSGQHGQCWNSIFARRIDTALAGPDPEATEVVHMCPPGDEALTPCCGKSPFELPLFSSRMTVDRSLVTCKGRPRARA